MSQGEGAGGQSAGLAGRHRRGRWLQHVAPKGWRRSGGHAPHRLAGMRSAPPFPLPNAARHRAHLQVPGPRWRAAPPQWASSPVLRTPAWPRAPACSRRSSASCCHSPPRHCRQTRCSCPADREGVGLHTERGHERSLGHVIGCGRSSRLAPAGLGQLCGACEAPDEAPGSQQAPDEAPGSQQAPGSRQAPGAQQAVAHRSADHRGGGVRAEQLAAEQQPALGVVQAHHVRPAGRGRQDGLQQRRV